MRWSTVNGWDALFAQAVEGIPALMPYYLTVNLSLPASADFQTSVTATAAAVISGGAEFWVVGANSGGWADGAGPIGEGLGSVSTESPDMYPATVVIREGDAGRTISAGPCHIGHLFGGGPRPYLWPAPWQILPGTELNFTVEHRFTTQQSVWLTLIGFRRFLSDPPLPVDFLLTPQVVRTLAKYRATGRNVSPQPFFYPMAFSGVVGRAPNQSEQRTIAITETDFALCHLAAVISDPADGTSWATQNCIDNNAHFSTETPPGRGVAQETVRLVTGLGQTRLDDRPVVLGSLFGTGRRIGRYPSPLVIPRGDTLSALVNFKDSTSGSNLPLRADLTFGGVRLVEK